MTRDPSIEESFSWFLTALGRYDPKHLDKNDEELLYIILEELDIEAISFLHKQTVDQLMEHKLIPADISDLVEDLRIKTLSVIEKTKTASEIRSKDHWLGLRQLAATIMTKINSHRN
ncbi:MAG: hypothetical protein V4580_19910 [Bacteroidota bacterium]